MRGTAHHNHPTLLLGAKSGAVQIAAYGELVLIVAVDDAKNGGIGHTGTVGALLGRIEAALMRDKPVAIGGQKRHERLRKTSIALKTTLGRINQRHRLRQRAEPAVKGHLQIRGACPPRQARGEDQHFMARRAIGLRAARRGIWAHPYYRVLDHREAGAHIDSFQLVEGTVLKAERRGARHYLNFAADFRSDFTIVIERRGARLFEDMDFDPLTLQGRTIRVRGWLKEWNGPMIEATHPEQIEVLK